MPNNSTFPLGVLSALFPLSMLLALASFVCAFSAHEGFTFSFGATIFAGLNFAAIAWLLNHEGAKCAAEKAALLEILGDPETTPEQRAEAFRAHCERR